MALPAAELLKKHYPDCRIKWVILDLFRDALGDNPFIDAIDIIPTYSCRNLFDVNEHIRKHRTYILDGQRSVEDHWGIHIDLYYGYIIERIKSNEWKLNRNPFYLQMFNNAVHFCPGVDLIESWTYPEWHPTKQAVNDCEEFEKLYGGGPVIIFSPFIADKTATKDNVTRFNMDLIYRELRKWKLPLIVTGTQWDEKVFPTWAIDGYAPILSLGGLFYLMKERAALVITPNSGIGFAAHWLGAPVLMIDNRTGWPEQVKEYRAKYRLLADDVPPNEYRWPMFMKGNFPSKHLLPIPFEQIEWSEDGFVETLAKMRK